MVGSFVEDEDGTGRGFELVKLDIVSGGYCPCQRWIVSTVRALVVGGLGVVLTSPEC